MGLSIHYKLTVPASTESRLRRQMLAQLRQAALDLPFQAVSDLEVARGRQCDYSRLDRNDPQIWFLMHAQMCLAYQFDQTGNPVTGCEHSGDIHCHSVTPRQVIGFTAWPGEGCEPCHLGLGLYPKTAIVPGIAKGRRHRLRVSDDGNWQWRSSSKTQFSNSPEAGGLPNFLRCHLSIIALLDAARRIGFEATVNDESGYWEHRDVKTLIQSIDNWDRILAAVGGAIKDVADAAGTTVESPMLDRPDFERLEHEGTPMLTAGWLEPVKSLIQATSISPKSM